MTKFIPVCIAVLTTSFMTGCVTQNYENDKTTPVIENDSSKNEIAMTRISLGLGYLKMGNTQQAKLNLEKAKRFSPNLVQVYTAFAHYYDTVGEPELSTESYEHALSIKDDDADTLNNYGVFLCRQKKYDEAEIQILKAIAIPSYILVAQSYENLALCQLKAKHYEKAELYLEKAILHSPNRASSILQMVRLQYAKTDYKIAQSYLHRYEKSTRRFSSNALALAYKVFEKQGSKRTAKNYGNMLVKMFPNSYEAKQFILNDLSRIDADNLADEYREAKNEAAGLTSKKRVIVLSPNKPNQAFDRNENKDALSANGLKPMMANSVMPTDAQKATSAQLNSVDESKLKVTEASAEIETTNNSALSPSDTSVSSDDNLNTEKLYSQNTMASLPIHSVQKGDSLFSISKQYNIVMKSLERWNKLSKPYLLRIGDIIYLANPKSVSRKKEQN
jgi:type IV pilus assembly protein PilF